MQNRKFYSKEQCEELIQIIEKNLLKSDANVIEDSTKSDQRIFFSEKISDKIYKYFKNDLVHKVGNFIPNLKLNQL